MLIQQTYFGKEIGALKSLIGTLVQVLHKRKLKQLRPLIYRTL